MDRVVDGLPSVAARDELTAVQTEAGPLMKELEQAGRLYLRDRLIEAFSAAHNRLADAADEPFPGDL